MPDELSCDGSGRAVARAIEVGVAPGNEFSWLS